jgi:hypothetical protein
MPVTGPLDPFLFEAKLIRVVARVLYQRTCCTNGLLVLPFKKLHRWGWTRKRQEVPWAFPLAVVVKQPPHPLESILKKGERGGGRARLVMHMFGRYGYMCDLPKSSRIGDHLTVSTDKILPRGQLSHLNDCRPFLKPFVLKSFSFDWSPVVSSYVPQS